MNDPRDDPRGLIPSSTEGDILKTTGGVAAWAAPAPSGVQTVTAGTYIKVDATDPAHIIVTAMVPLTTFVDGKWEIMFDTNGQIVQTDAP